MPIIMIFLKRLVTLWTVSPVVWKAKLAALYAILLDEYRMEARENAKDIIEQVMDNNDFSMEEMLEETGRNHEEDLIG